MKFSLFEEINKYTPKGYNKKVNQYYKRKKKPLFDSEKNDYQWNALFLMAGLGLVYFLFLGKSFSIQIANRPKYLTLAKSNSIREYSVMAERGVIYDRNGNVIVRNKPTFTVQLNTLDCNNPELESSCEDTIGQVQKYLEFDQEELEAIKQAVSSGQTNIVLASNLSREEILPLDANISKITGLAITANPARDYLYSDAFSHLIGYVGLGDSLSPEVVGKTGVEEYYNEFISGYNGSQITQVDSTGSRNDPISFKEPLPGKNITLYTDLSLQLEAYKLLKDFVEDPENETSAGVVVAQDPLNGGVLALVSYPGFDPNLLSYNISQKEVERLNTDTRFPFFNRAISGAYPPGSTFKLITASAVLMENIADRNLTIFDNGFIQVGSFIFRNWKTDGHGEVDMLRALQVSNDTYFYTVGGGYGGVKGLGIKLLHDWAVKFGLNKKTGIDLYGEVAGFMPDGTHRDWYLGDDYISAIGQGDILATPIQINNMTSYFANGGTLFMPRVAKNIDGVGDMQNHIISQNIVDADTYDTVRQGINYAVEPGGTGYPVFDFPIKHNGIELAGKTGTSEYIDSNGEDKTHAWFTVFGPYKETQIEQASVSESENPIVLTVFLEGGGSGSDDAAPIAAELLNFWYSN